MTYNILNPGDHVITVTNELIAVERYNGSVDVYSLLKKRGSISLSPEPSFTIGYDGSDQSAVIETHITDNGVKIIEF